MVNKVAVIAEITAPKGGRIHIVNVLVDPARDWQEAIDTAGPDTPQSYAVRKVGDQYPPEGGQIQNQEVVLVNFDKTIPNVQYVIDWGEQQKLLPADPRRTFAVGEHKPSLHRELGLRFMAIISPVECAFEGGRDVPYVWLGGANRNCDLHWFGFGFSGNVWFAFVRES